MTLREENFTRASGLIRLPVSTFRPGREAVSRYGTEPLRRKYEKDGIRNRLHLVGTFGWVPAQNKYAVAQDNVNIFQYNVGVELGFVQPLGGSWELRPFVGAGVGGRTYAYQAATLSNKTCAAGYGALGTEFQLARTALRLEARDNVFCFKSPIAGVSSKTRNDIGLAFGVAYHLR